MEYAAIKIAASAVTDTRNIFGCCPTKAIFCLAEIMRAVINSVRAIIIIDSVSIRVKEEK